MKKIILITTCSLLFGSINQQELIKDIEKSLMAPCCWSGTVNDHGHSELEQEIQSMVEAGQTKDQIMNHYVRIYGERILAIPVAQGFNIMAWLAPIIIAIIGITFLVLYLKSSTSKSLELDSISTGDESIPYNEQIEKELKELD
ncbi:MAG: cytochrome c-type biogenesis protein CcmH [Candidatus Marinimicrobia bacterium]|nr:cytochrome c-type biogenesis protein CcmH [Candidatus Neomarinimicrobiota bacterium]